MRMKRRFRVFLKMLMSGLKFRKKITFRELHFLHDKWRHFNMSVVGLWPYQSRRSKRVSYGCFLVSSLSIIVALTAGLTDKWSTEPLIILENTLGIMFVGIGLVSCTIAYKHEHKVKKLHDKVVKDRKEIRDKEELGILKAIHRQEIITTFAIIIYSVPAFFIFGAITFYPEWKIVTTSKEYNRVFPYYYSHMVVIESMYFYQSVGHTVISLLYSSLAFMAIHCIFIGPVNHVCAKYAIVSCQLRNLKKSRSINALEDLKRNRMILSKLMTVINRHRDAMHMVHSIEEISSKGVLIVETLAMFVITLVMVEVVCNNDKPLQFLRAAMVSGIFIFYLFHINFTAGQVIHVSRNIGISAYFADWVDMSVEVRKLLCMIIMRSSKSEKLTAGSIVTMSNESTAVFLKTCWAFATVLLSSQRHFGNTCQCD